MKLHRLALLLLVGCGSPALVVANADGGLEESDAATSSTPVNEPDALAEGPDALAGEQDAGIEEPEDAEAPVDATPPRADASKPDASVKDSGAPDVSVPDATPVTDAGTDSGADAGPCVDYVVLPESPNWAAWAHYTLSSNSSTSVPYYCPSTVEGNSCKYALLSKGATQQPNGKYYLYPFKGACRIDVPAKCLPCTGTTTQW